MRALLLFVLLAGCAQAPVGPLLAAEGASVMVFGRGVGDIVVSAVSGHDCSIVRLDRGLTYCAARDPPPAPAPFCSRSLGTVDCWSNPEAFARPPRSITDGPALSPVQERHRAARWPKALTAVP